MDNRSKRDDSPYAMILAGGKSSRMGTSKALLPFPEGPLLGRQIRACASRFERIVVMAASQDWEAIRSLLLRLPEPIGESVEMYADDPSYAGEGPVAGFYSGLLQAGSSSCFVCSCDLPFLDAAFVGGLADYAERFPGYDAYVPVEQGRFQPLASYYQLNGQRLVRYLDMGDRSWKQLLATLNVCWIPETTWKTWSGQDRLFFNVNTVADYEQALKHAES